MYRGAPENPERAFARRSDHRALQPDPQRGNRHDQTGKRPGDRNIEERAAVMRRRLHFDERAESPERERDWDEVRRRHIHPVAARGEIMPELVDAEDEEQPESVRKSDRDAGRILQDINAAMRRP